MHRLLRLTALAATALLLMPSLPAGADASGLGWSDDKGVGAKAEEQDSTPAEAPAQRSRSGSWPQCRYEVMGPSDAEIADHMAKNGLGTSRGDGPGTWYWKTCEDANGMMTGETAWAPERPDPVVVARKALRYTELGNPTIGMSPAPRQGAVVNVPVWLWVKPDAWEPTAATATIDGLSVQTTATPERVVWRLGTGDELTCEGPGTPYDPTRPEAEQHSDCTHLFDQPGTYTVTATVEWRARWSVVGGAGGGDLGLVRRSSSTTIDVSEIQALNRPPR